MVFAPVALAVVAAGLGILYRDIPRGGATRRNALVSLSVAAVGSAVWLALGSLVGAGVVDGLFPSIAILAGMATLLATFAVRERVEGIAAALIFAGAWCACVFVPVAVAVFSTNDIFQSFGLDPLDHGGALPVFVAPAAASVAVLLVERGRTERTTVDIYPTSPAAVNLAMWAGWVAALVFLELAIDEVSLRIVVNATLAPLFGVLGWLVMQRIHHQVSTLAGAAAGFVTGLAGITAGAAFIDPIWASITGFAAAALSASFVHRRVRRSHLESWFIVGAHLVAPVTGLVLLALFAGGIGFVFTGQISLAQAEFTAILATVVYSFAVSIVLWALLRLTFARGLLAGA
jgi:Amt family ammonium transporter